jgi:hypothetical protein
MDFGERRVSLLSVYQRPLPYIIPSSEEHDLFISVKQIKARRSRKGSKARFFGQRQEIKGHHRQKSGQTQFIFSPYALLVLHGPTWPLMPVSKEILSLVSFFLVLFSFFFFKSLNNFLIPLPHSLPLNQSQKKTLSS